MSLGLLLTHSGVGKVRLGTGTEAKSSASVGDLKRGLATSAFEQRQREVDPVAGGGADDGSAAIQYVGGWARALVRYDR